MTAAATLAAERSLEKRMPEERKPEERTFRTHDGVDLFYRHWPATGPCRGAILMFHRGHEHSGRMAHLVGELDLAGFDFYAWDSRGHGRSPGERGHAPSLADSIRDVQTFVDHIGSAHGVPVEDVFVVAQSVGAVVVSAWVHDYAPRIRGMVLASPAFKVKLYVPLARPGLALMHKLRGTFYVQSYVKAKFLTHDPERIASFDADPLITRAIAVNILLDLYDTAERIVADAEAITVPTMLLISGADWVVHHGPQHRFFDELGSAVKEKIELPGFFHDTLGELDRMKAIAPLRRFLLARFEGDAAASAQVSRLDAHRRGYTHDESRALAEPLAWYTPRGAYWAMTRASLKLGGALSRGVAIGHDTGFDSGTTLDYVYRNERQGAGPLGRMIDKTYLDSIGWRGIRQRKIHVEELLRDAMQRLAAAAKPVRVMDVAAGHGRYVLDAVLGSAVKPESILLRDYSDINVRDGQALIAAKGLQATARFVKADAFDRAGLAAVQPKPTLAVVSGLYELFPDNDAVGASLAGIADAVEPGGYLVYTGQPWHPQLELIARALTSHRQGQAWVMRRRTQVEMDQLVEAAGFRKLTQRIDRWGIFSVSLAERVAAR